MCMLWSNIVHFARRRCEVAKAGDNITSEFNVIIRRSAVIISSIAHTSRRRADCLPTHSYCGYYLFKKSWPPASNSKLSIVIFYFLFAAPEFDGLGGYTVIRFESNSILDNEFILTFLMIYKWFGYYFANIAVYIFLITLINLLIGKIVSI